MARARFTSIDLFAGCGGLSLGLHRAGWDGLFAIEKDPMAFDTLHANLVADSAPYLAYPKWPSWLPVQANDLRALLADEQMRERFSRLKGNVTLVAGGPPCQGFSVGGARNGADERNTLVHAQLDVVALVRPKLALVENVEGITRPFLSRPGERQGPGGSVAEDVVKSLHDMGYAAAFGIVDASRFGVPQLRRRAVILGVREDLHKDPRSLWAELEDVREPMLKAIGLPVDRAVTAREALDDLWGPQPKVPCPDSPAYMSVAYRDATSRYAEELRCGIPTGAVPDSHRFSKHGDRILALYRRAHETQPPGRLSKAFLLENDTKKDKKVLIDPDVPVSTITTHPDEFIHYAEPRNVTVREMARLQSFPDDFRFLGRYTINGPRRRFDVARCSQVGNAVPPLLAQGLGLALRRFV